MLRGKTVSLWALGLLAAIGNAGVQAEDDFVPGAFILEFEDNVNIVEQLASVNHIAAPRMILNHTLFKGASVQFHNVDAAAEHASLLSGSPVVKQIWPMRRYSRPDYKVQWTAGEYATAEEADGAAARARQQMTDTFTPHVMTQVDQLRDRGVTGKGIKIAILDTGVDYLHPALGGGFGDGFLVGFGYDLVGDAFQGNGTNVDIPVPDPDPVDNCSGHGSHVSGTIAAQINNPYGIIGAATGVTLGMYRIFGCEGATQEDVILAAFNMAYEAGADIITASLGIPTGWSSQLLASAVSRIVDRGVVCTNSAGNSADAGLFYASSAAVGKGVTAVGSVDNIISPVLVINSTYTTTGGEEVAFGYAPGTVAAWDNLTLPLYRYFVSTNDSIIPDATVVDDACTPLPDGTDLSGFAVLVRRGNCTFIDKFDNVANAGGRYVILYNDRASVPRGAYPDLQPDPSTNVTAIAAIDEATGERLAAIIESGQNITVTLPAWDPETSVRYLAEEVNNITGGYMSFYSSWGPSNWVEQYPSLSAPGGDILSTWPRALGSYATLSGTSMSTPLMAGIYALLMEVRGTKDPKTLRSLLMSTAKPISYNDKHTTFPYLAPTAQQGAGLVQAFDAAFVTTELSIDNLSFNDTDNIVPEQNFTIINNGNTTVTYTLRNSPAAAAYTFNSTGDIIPSIFPPNVVSDSSTSASIAFNIDNPLVLAPGARKDVQVTLTPPSLDASLLPVYSGYIVINGSDDSALSLPYLGVVGSLKSATVIDKSQSFLTDSVIPANATDIVPIAAGRAFTLPPPGRSNDTQYDSKTFNYPEMVRFLAMGSPLVRYEVVPVAVPANFTGVRDAWLTPLRWRTRSYMAGGPNKYDWDGRLSTEDYAPAGTYRMRLRALKIFGDEENDADYEVYESPEFSISYLSNDSSTSAVARRRKRASPSSWSSYLSARGARVWGR